MITRKSKAPSVLLVNPSLGTKEFVREDRFRSYLSLGTLASALRDKSFLRKFAVQSRRKEILPEDEEDFPSFQVKVANLSLKPNGQDIAEYLAARVKEMGNQPALLCATATSAQLDEVKEVAEAAKRVAPDALRVIGGPHVSVLPKEFLQLSEYQVACIGEGVETLTELALSFLLSGMGAVAGVSGIAYKDEDGTIHLTPPRQFLFGLDEYPFPSDSLDLFTDDLEDREKNAQDLVYLLAGSGCPYRCVFCAQHAIHKGVIRERSADNIISEIMKLQVLGFHKFAIVQETFLTNKARIERFCQLIENSGLPFEWTVEARADQVSFELLARMRAAGLRFIQIGVESGDQALLNVLGKGIVLEQVRKVRDWCESLKIDTSFYMLVGLPGQDWQSILRSALFLRDHAPYNRITMHNPVSLAIPYPGTKMAEEASVRLIGRAEQSLNWPERNCEVTADENGAFIGKNPTETDAMTSEGILEAYIFLDDFGDFLLHARYDPSYTCEKRLKAMDFSNRIFYMIERRTMRDLVARAQKDLTPDKYIRAHTEILRRDKGQEMYLKDVTASMEPISENFTNFLVSIHFTNGFHTMKCFRIGNRVKWMKLCALVWKRCRSKWEHIRFDPDHESVGEEYNRLLDRVTVNTLNAMLEMVDRGMEVDALWGDIFLEGNVIKAFGFHFTPDSEGLIRVSLR